MEINDTICAISTPPGEAGIGIVRISGQMAYPILTKIFRPKSKCSNLASHRFYLGKIVEPKTGKVVDEVLVVYMKAPKTYTREDVVEIHTHGGYFVQQRILSLVLEEGARLAEPGEFTKRAFLNGRIDLLQAESVLSIIQSESESELECALAQLDGKVSRRIQKIKETIRTALALIEAQIDFPEEDIEIDMKEVSDLIRKARQDIHYLLSSYSAGRIIREGYLVMLVGRTNVGKSSLLNEIVLKERAIVTPFPGTTRDFIEEVINVKGMKIKIVDTAGMRDPKDVIEKEGIERVKKKIPEADLILWVLDGSSAINDDDLRIYEEIKGKDLIAVINKIDLGQRIDLDFFDKNGILTVRTSALTGEGIGDLKESIFERLTKKSPKKGKVVITSTRHKEALERAKDCLERADICLGKDASFELASLDLKEALSSVCEITGEVYSEDILDEIFSRFCIGK